MNDDRAARAALTRLFESGDATGLALVAEHGAHAALRIAIGTRPRTRPVTSPPPSWPKDSAAGHPASLK
jgi:hypothetical protein